jgi:hypothetical protein
MRVAWPVDEGARLAAVEVPNWPVRADACLDGISAFAAEPLGTPFAIIMAPSATLLELNDSGAGVEMLCDPWRWKSSRKA